MRIVIGPVSSAAARAWTEHTLDNLSIVRRSRHVLPFRFPVEIADVFAALLLDWHRVADRGPVFVWEADMEEAQVRMLVQYWANLDSLTDHHLDLMGITWSPPEAKDFFDALATGVAAAFEAAGTPEPFSEMLAAQADPA